MLDTKFTHGAFVRLTTSHGELTVKPRKRTSIPTEKITSIGIYSLLEGAAARTVYLPGGGVRKERRESEKEKEAHRREGTKKKKDLFSFSPFSMVVC